MKKSILLLIGIIGCMATMQAHKNFRTPERIRAEILSFKRVQSQIAGRVSRGRLLDLHKSLEQRIAHNKAELAAMSEPIVPVTVPTSPQSMDMVDALIAPEGQSLATVPAPRYSRSRAAWLAPKRHRKLIAALALGGATAAVATPVSVGAYRGYRGTRANTGNRFSPHNWGVRMGSHYHRSKSS